MSTRVAPLGSLRVTVLLAVVLVLMCAVAAPAFATEAGGAAPTEADEHVTIDDIGTKNEVSNQYRPEPAEAPPFMKWLSVPLAIAGVLVTLALLFMYLTWQPRFAEERRSRRRR